MFRSSYYDMDYEEIAKLAKERLDIDDVEEYGLLKVIDMLEEEIPADEMFGANLEALQDKWNEYPFGGGEEGRNETPEQHIKRMALWKVALANLNALYDLLDAII